jgi:hypothetical protein
MNNDPESGVVADLQHFHIHIGKRALQLSGRMLEDRKLDQEEQ